MPSSMLTSTMLAPPRTCSIATAAASVKLPSLIRRANFFEPVTFVRSPIIWKLLSSRMISGSRPESRVGSAGASPRRPRRQPLYGGAHRRDVIRRRAAAAADDVGEAAGDELAQQSGGLRRQLVVLAERVRQAGVGIDAHPALGEPRQLGEVRPHLAGAERAVEADAPRFRVLDREVERVERLARQRAPAAIGDRHRDHQRHVDAERLLHFLDGDDRGLRVQRVEDRLEQQDVGAAVDQAADLVGVGRAHLVERHRAERRVVDVGRDRERAVGRADRAGDEPGLLRRAPRVLVGRLAREPRGGDVDVVDVRLEPVVRLRDGVAVERVGLDDVRAGLEVLAVDAADDVGPRQHEHVGVALEVVRMIGEPRAAIVGLAQRVALDHRAHRAVQNQDALRAAGCRALELWSLSVPSAGFRPRADQHRERIADSSSRRRAR